MQRIGRGSSDDNSFLTGEQIFIGFKKVIDKIIEINSSKEYPSTVFERKLSHLVKSIFYGVQEFMCMRAPCGAGHDILGFDIHGGFYICDDFINDAEFKIGDVYSGSIKEQMKNSDVLRKKLNRSMKDLPRCSNCIWRSLCGGICYSSDHYTGANGIEKLEYCEFYQKIIPYLIEKYADNPELPQLIDDKLNYNLNNYCFNLNDGEKAIDLECYEALLKLHRIGYPTKVYLRLNQTDVFSDIAEYINTTKTVGASPNMVIDSNNIMLLRNTQVLDDISSSNSVVIVIGNEVNLSKDEESAYIQTAINHLKERNKKITIKLVMSLTKIVEEQVKCFSVIEMLSEKDEIVIACDSSSNNESVSGNEILTQLQNAEHKLKLRIYGVNIEDIDLDNLPYVLNNEGEDIILIDENNFLGVKVNVFPDWKIVEKH